MYGCYYFFGGLHTQAALDLNLCKFMTSLFGLDTGFGKKGLSWFKLFFRLWVAYQIVKPKITGNIFILGIAFGFILVYWILNRFKRQRITILGVGHFLFTFIPLLFFLFLPEIMWAFNFFDGELMLNILLFSSVLFLIGQLLFLSNLCVSLLQKNTLG